MLSDKLLSDKKGNFTIERASFITTIMKYVNVNTNRHRRIDIVIMATEKKTIYTYFPRQKKVIITLFFLN